MRRDASRVTAMLALGTTLVLTAPGASNACTVAADCDDGNVCNGVETCDVATQQCLPGTPVNCDDGNPCTVDACVPQSGCIHPLTGSGIFCYVSIFDGQLAQALALLRSTVAGQLGGPSTKQRLVGYVVTMRRLLGKLIQPVAEVAPDVAGSHCPRCLRVLRRSCLLSERFRSLVAKDMARGTIEPGLAEHLLVLVPDCRATLCPGLSLVCNPMPAASTAW